MGEDARFELRSLNTLLLFYATELSRFGVGRYGRACTLNSLNLDASDPSYIDIESYIRRAMQCMTVNQSQVT